MNGEKGWRTWELTSLQFRAALRESSFKGEDKRNVWFGKDQGKYKGMKEKSKRGMRHEASARQQEDDEE